MKLTFEQIKSAAWGASRVAEENGAIRFYRFSDEQEAAYKGGYERFYLRTFASAGIKLVFNTDSENLFFKVNVSSAATQRLFSFDVFVNGKLIGYLDDFSDITLPENYVDYIVPLGEFSKKFSLGKGEKEVKIYFPWSVTVEVTDIVLDDGASFSPVEKKKRMFTFGDSITQGYHSLRPSVRYSARLAEALDAEEVCKAIGGEKFFPQLAAAKDELVPDYITVAYGTNDWANLSREIVEEKCREFFAALHNNYPKAKIIAITPIWRKNYSDNKAFGPFCEVDKVIRDCVVTYPNVQVISGFDLVPHDERYFADVALHPNDDGFKLYFDNLYKEITKISL